MNQGSKFSILAFAFLALSGLLLQSCKTPFLKPAAVLEAGGECDLGNAYAGEIVLNVGDEDCVEGTTVGRPDMVSSYCNEEYGPYNAPDAVYKLTVTECVYVEGSVCGEFCPIISFWNSCPSMDPENEECNGSEGCAAFEGLLEPGTYYISIEAHPDCSGSPTADFEVCYAVSSCESVETVGAKGLKFGKKK